MTPITNLMIQLSKHQNLPFMIRAARDHRNPSQVGAPGRERAGREAEVTRTAEVGLGVEATPQKSSDTVEDDIIRGRLVVESIADMGVRFMTRTEKGTTTETHLVAETGIIIAGTGTNLMAETKIHPVAEVGNDLTAETDTSIIVAGTETSLVAETGACVIIAGIKSNTTASTEISIIMIGTSIIGETRDTEITMTTEVGRVLIELNRIDIIGEIALLLVGADLVRDQEIHVESGVKAEVTLDQKGNVAGITLMNLMVRQTLVRAPMVVEMTQKQRILVKATVHLRNPPWRQSVLHLLVPNRRKLLS